MSTQFQDPNATAEPTTAEIETALTKLKAQLREVQIRGGHHMVETDLGRLSAPQLLKEINRQSEELRLIALRNERAQAEVSESNIVAYITSDGERKWRPKDAPNPHLCASETELQTLFGLTAYSRLTPEERAKARDLRESDVRDENISKYFGPGSSAVEAGRLMKTNPAKYRVLRARARTAGLC